MDLGLAPWFTSLLYSVIGKGIKKIIIDHEVHTILGSNASFFFFW